MSLIVEDEVERFDLASGKEITRRATPSGVGIVLAANLTRTGVFKYVQPDGSVRRELRPPEEVFDKESLDTLAHATVTDDHPQEQVVNTDNWREETRGHVSEAKRDGDFVAGDIHLQDGGAIEKTGRGKLVELSCGYKCRLDKTPGEYKGEPYDVVQRKIRYNHVAMLPAGTGRAGPDVRMRLDSGASVSGFDEAYLRDMKTVEELAKELATAEANLKVANEAATAARNDAAASKTDAEKASSTIALRDAEIVVLKAKNEILELQAARVTADSASKDFAARVDAAAESKIAVRADAAKVFGSDWSPEGKSVAEIKRAVIAELEPDFKIDGRDDSAIDVAYEMALKAHGRTSARRADLQGLTVPHADAMAKEGEKDEVADARDAMIKRKQDKWKKDRGGKADKGGK